MQRYCGSKWKFLTFLETETMNKFEALKIFQGWPPEWQRLCAEYWIETGEDRPAVSATASNLSQVWCHADQVELAKKLLEPVATLAHESVSTRLAQDKAAKVAAVPARNNMRYTRNELIEVDSHYSEGRGPAEVARIMDRKYPNQRTLGAWSMMVDRLKTKGLQAMLKKAIDVEFK
jgi:hypothetical protein